MPITHHLRSAAVALLGVPTEILVVVDDFGEALPVQAVGEALVSGLAAGGQPARVAGLSDRDYDAQMRGSLAVLVGAERLHREALAGSVLAEVATCARQAGVPCHAVVGANELDLFDMRILDLQLVIEASTVPELQRAGAEIAAAIAADRARGA